MRAMILANPPQDVDSLIVPETSVWAVLFETGYAKGPVTLLVVGDGTTSLYLPTGGGVIGAGEHASVRAASTALMITADAMRSALKPAKDTNFPAEGRVRIFVLTKKGTLLAEEDEEKLGTGVGPLSAIFHAGQAVISQIRMICEPQTLG
jgi:hypothetical protein